MPRFGFFDLAERSYSGIAITFYLTANDAQNWYPITQTDTLEFEPGTKYNYSNPAFNALALIIEKVSGQKWQTFISENIFKRAGYNYTGFKAQFGVSANLRIF